MTPVKALSTGVGLSQGQGLGLTRKELGFAYHHLGRGSRFVSFLGVAHLRNVRTAISLSLLVLLSSGIILMNSDVLKWNERMRERQAAWRVLSLKLVPNEILTTINTKVQLLKGDALSKYLR